MKTIHTSGKRKTSIARASLKQGKGIIKINNQLLDSLNSEFVKHKIQEPLILAKEIAKKIDIKVDVKGGGWQSQAEACRLAIGRSLVKFQTNLKKTFIDYDRTLLIADIRYKEPCKPNISKARKKRQKSYR